MNKEGIAGKIIFGGPGGNFTPLNSTQGQVIVFKGGARLDSIQIGDNKYGGKGGSEQGRAVLPADGTFTITKLQANNTWCVSYLEAIIDGVTIKVGTLNKSSIINLDLNMKVSLSGINSGDFVDSLQFNIVQ